MTSLRPRIKQSCSFFWCFAVVVFPCGSFFPVDVVFASSPAGSSAPCLRAVLPFAAAASAVSVVPSCWALSGWLLVAFFPGRAAAESFAAAAVAGVPSLSLVSLRCVRPGLWSASVGVWVAFAPVPPLSCPVAFLPLR
jgi:hypothetical protein